MTTSLDTCIDPQGAALATLIKGAVNYEMINDARFRVTEESISNVYGTPRPLDIIAALNLPALCIYRFAETFEEFTFEKQYYVVDFRFDYFTKAVKRESLEKRWKLLRPVWRRLLDVIYAGKHDEVHDGRAILDAAGIEELEEKAIRVLYDFAPGTEGNVYPYFRGQIRLKHLEIDPETAQSQLFLSLAANYILDGLEPEAQPLIESLTLTPTGQDAKDAEDNPDDPDFVCEDS